MKKMIYALALFAALAGVAKAQEYAQDRAKVAIGFTHANVPVGGDSVKGLNVAGQVKLYGYEGVKLEAVGDFVALFPTGTENVYTYMGGPQVGVDLFERRLTLFGRAMFGAANVGEYGYRESYYGHSLGGGVDVNVTNRVFFRLTHDVQRFNAAEQNINRSVVSVGLRF